MAMARVAVTLNTSELAVAITMTIIMASIIVITSNILVA